VSAEDPGTTGRQLLRYGVVGVGSNLLLYMAYLALTTSGLGSKTAMTVTYCMGVAGTFVLNRNWSFGDDGPWRKSLVLYVCIYAIGYIVNFFGLLLLVDVARLPHQIAQAILIVAVAASLFALQKFWIFNRQERARVVHPAADGGR